MKRRMVLAVGLYFAGAFGAASAKELKDFSDEEKGRMGLLASKFCKAGPGKYSPTSSRDAETFVKWVEEDADGVNDRLLAVMNILVRQHGMAQTCDMLFVESIIMKPGSKP